MKQHHPTQIAYADGVKYGREFELNRIWEAAKKQQHIGEVFELNKLAGVITMRQLHTIIFGELEKLHE